MQARNMCLSESVHDINLKLVIILNMKIFFAFFCLTRSPINTLQITSKDITPGDSQMVMEPVYL